MTNLPKSRVSYLPLKAAENGDWTEEGLLPENGDPFKYDLEERTVNDRLISQLVGAATSVGVSDCEADDAVSKKDFRCKIGPCKKEARETKFVLRMVAAAEESLRPEARVLCQEANMRHSPSTLHISRSFVIGHSTFVILPRL